MPLGPKFVSQLELDLSGQGLYKDLLNSTSKCIEMIDKGCNFSESWFKKVLVQFSLFDFYNIRPNNHILHLGGLSVGHPVCDLL